MFKSFAIAVLPFASAVSQGSPSVTTGFSAGFEEGDHNSYAAVDLGGEQESAWGRSYDSVTANSIDDIQFRKIIGNTDNSVYDSMGGKFGIDEHLGVSAAAAAQARTFNNFAVVADARSEAV